MMQDKVFVSKAGRHHYKWMKYRRSNVAIDVDISSLLSKMWKLGIGTSNSCHGDCSFICDHEYRKHPPDKQGHIYIEKIKKKYCNDNVWIVFESAQDIEIFYNIVSKYTDPMYDNITGYNRIESPRDAWIQKSYLTNHGIVGHWGRPIRNGIRSSREQFIEDSCSENNFILEPQLTFPRRHIEYIESKLDLALKKK